MKKCPSCRRTLPLDEFPRNRSARDGRGSYCRPCHNRIGRENRERRHGSTRHHHLVRRHGITGAQADALVEAQGGRCAICGERPAEHVDHDHATGSVRGMLCFNCSGGLGRFRDRPELLRLAAAYLERPVAELPLAGPQQLVLGFSS